MSNCSENKKEPKKLNFSLKDYFKSLYCWINAFKKTFIINPGLYYTGGKYDINAPLLVTCNYHLTVFLLWRIIRKLNIRLLIIDTKGINVWCSSGKGQFSAKEIIRQLSRYSPELLTKGGKLKIILPKLSLSGVSLRELKKELITPLVGPVYLKDIPKFLKEEPHKSKNEEKYEFNIKDRLFTLIPGSIKFSKYLLYIILGLFIWNHFFITDIYWQPYLLGLLIGFLYIVLFPILPTKKFAVKGIFLGVFLAILFLFYQFKMNSFEILTAAYYTLFIISTSIWFGLYYTGDSGVSNYSLVKKEIKIFLPLAFITQLASVILIIIKGAA